MVMRTLTPDRLHFSSLASTGSSSLAGDGIINSPRFDELFELELIDDVFLAMIKNPLNISAGSADGSIGPIVTVTVSSFLYDLLIRQ